MVKDPVCGMNVDPERTKHSTHLHGTAYYFCSAHCLQKFSTDPHAFLKSPDTAAADRPPAAGDDATEYYCPMHPEVVADKPGVCPKCGMALEPRAALGGAEETSHTRDLRRRFVVSAICTAPVMLLMAADIIPTLQGMIPARVSALLQGLLTTPVVFWGALPFYRSAWTGLKARAANMYTLISIGVGAAYLFSAAVLARPGLILNHDNGALHVYFDTAAVITTLILLGEWLQMLARGKTSEAIRKLAGLQVKHAHVVRDGTEHDVPLEQVRAGDLLRVKPGERVPTDGDVIDGAATADESMLTGESVPVRKSAGDHVIGATTISGGSLLIRATKLGNDSLLGQIIRLVRDAQSSRAPVQKLADRISAIFVPVVIAVAVLTFVVWSIWGPPPSMVSGLINAVAVLIIACPCALGLATPMAISAAVGRGAGHGILIKQAAALESAGTIDVLVTDKTGTLTEGRPGIVGIEAYHDAREADVLRLAAAVEQHSEHPLAAAVIAAARERRLSPPDARDFHTITGRGVRATVSGDTVLVGSAAFLRDAGITPVDAVRTAPAHLATATTVEVAAGRKHIGTIYIADPVRKTTPEVIAALHRAGVAVVMASGDRAATAQAIARELGIDAVHAPVLPQDKVRIVKELQAQGKRVMFAGDGINDAPALAQADAGVAMATGTEIAMEAADITILHGDLTRLLGTIQLSRRTRRVVRQNLFWAFLYNTAGVPIAAGLLYPFFGLLLSPVFASVAMSLSSLSVVLNSLRLRMISLRTS